MDTDSVLAIEEQHQLWEPEIRGVKLWALIRVPVLIQYVSKQVGYIPLSAPQRKFHFSKMRFRRYMRTLQMLIAAPNASFTELLFVTDLARYPVDARYSYNRFYERLFGAFTNPLIFETNRTTQIAKPDQHFESNIFTQSVLAHWAFANARLNKLTPTERETAAIFAARVADLYQMPDKSAQYSAHIQAYLSRYSVIRTFLERWIVPKFGERRFALIEDAHYMGREGLITKVLHDAGFQVAELQHGLISKQHYAYNLPLSCLNDVNHPCRAYLPDIFFTFGDYWSDQSQVPAEKISVGSPYLTEVKHLLQGIAPVPGQILILSGDGRALALAQELAQAFPQRKLIFKLHPVEIHLYETYAASLRFPNVEVVAQGNVYELIAASEIIVGHSSTALIEAVAFENKRIFYSDPEYIPADVGDRFASTAELIDLINHPTRGYPRGKAENFWRFDFDERVAFLNQQRKPSQ